MKKPVPRPPRRGDRQEGTSEALQDLDRHIAAAGLRNRGCSAVPRHNAGWSGWSRTPVIVRVLNDKRDLRGQDVALAQPVAERRIFEQGRPLRRDMPEVHPRGECIASPLQREVILRTRIKGEVGRIGLFLALQVDAGRANGPDTLGIAGRERDRRADRWRRTVPASLCSTFTPALTEKPPNFDIGVCLEPIELASCSAR